MKKMWVLLVILLTVSITSFAFASSEWTCAECQEVSSKNFCANCGASKPTERNVELKDGQYLLKLDIEFIENLMFSTYDVEIYIDDTFVARMKHGVDLQESVAVNKGKHTINFYNAEDRLISGFTMLDVTKETYLDCTISTHYDEISVTNVRSNGTVSEEDQEAYAKKAYIDSCKTPKYKDIERYPDKNKGTRIKVSGKVIQVAEGWFGSVILRVNDSNGDTWYVNYEHKEGEGRILENDRVVIYGECQGVETYTSLLGGSITIPAIEAKYIERK